MEPLMPFKYVIISPEDTSMKEGCIISEFNQCGLFLCQKGQAEILLGGRPYQINKRNLFIYTAANLLQIRQRSADLEGIMIEVDLDYVIPIVNKVANSENLLYLRENPCLSLSEEQYTFVENLLKSVEKRINRENICNSSRQKQHLISELIKSWGQVICYELLNIYFNNEPQTPLPQDKKDKIFQNFMITLYRYYHQERDVTFYADKQCLSTRYFSSVIKEKSGSSALQWIIQNVITEAKYLLDNTDLSIKEIATKLNFPTQSFFGKYFKQYVGMSPKEYRNKIIKQ